MRKYLALAAAVVLLTGMVSCGQQGGAQPAPAATTAAQTAQAATTAAQTAQAETGASGNPGGAKSDVMKVAMITGIGDINELSFNQSAYEACKAYCDLNGLEFTYSRPDEETTEGRAKAIGKAVEEGYNVIVLPGYSFAGCLLETTEKYPDVKFIALDVSDDDILREALGDKYDGRPGYWNAADYYYEDNVYCAVYQEEIAGYMAGMAAVKMGYKKLGFLGGVAVPAVIRYGSGFVQGANAAASELGLEDVEVVYAYGNQFFGDAEITADMDKWYADGVECIFACGGGIGSSAGEAAKKAGGKLIGVDVDQKGVLDGEYGEGTTVTSAMKGLAVTVNTTLGAIKHGEWESCRGKITRLGLVSGEDPVQNCVQLPMSTTACCETFPHDDYRSMVAGIYDGERHVADDISSEKPFADRIKVTYLGNLK